MHLAQIGVHRPEVAREIGEDLDRVGADGEQPGLRVVRVGGENAGGDQRQRRAADRRIVPQPPRRVGVPFGQWAAGRVDRAQRAAAVGGEKNRGAAEGERVSSARGQ